MNFENRQRWAVLLVLVLWGLPRAGMTASVTRTLDLDGFTSIAVFLPGDVAVTQSDDFHVEVTVSAEDVDAIDITVSGATLVMDLKPGRRHFDTLTASVRMPALHSVEIVGTTNLTLSGFEQEQLDVDIVGTGHVLGQSMHVGDLSVSIVGTGGVDFGDIDPLQVAHVALDGVIEVILNMDVRSTVEGHMTGLAKLRYWGTDVDLEVVAIGLSSIKNLGETKNAGAFRINSGLNDAWIDPAKPGQGFVVVVFPEQGSVWLAWFTYDTELPPAYVGANLGDAGHRWLTAQGPISGNESVMNINVTSGGIFDTATEIRNTSPAGSDGTIRLSFEDCNSGTVEYDLPKIGKQGNVPIQRIADDNIELCEELSR